MLAVALVGIVIIQNESRESERLQQLEREGNPANWLRDDY
jgi:hypothetical protein